MCIFIYVIVFVIVFIVIAVIVGIFGSNHGSFSSSATLVLQSPATNAPVR